MVVEYSGSFTVSIEKGLHTRPAAEIVNCTSQYKSDVYLVCRGIKVNAKSLLGIMTLAAKHGSHLIVEARGDDARQAVEALVTLAKNGFGEGS